MPGGLEKILVHSSRIFFLFHSSVLQIRYYVLTVVWGTGQGALIANLLAVVYDACVVEQLASVFGLELCFEGIGGTIGPLVCC